MPHNLIPRKDSEFDSFQDNFVTQVDAHEVAWGILPADITALKAHQTPWTAIWNVAQHKTNRTPAQTQTKDDVREVYERALRNFIQKWIFRNDLMSAGDLELCGITPHETTHTPTPVPVTLPVLDTLPDAGHRVKIFFRQQPDAEGVSRRGKPEGVKFCEFAFNYDTIPPSPDECANKSLIRRSPEVAEFPQNEAGRKVYYFARWVNINGQPGPWTDMNQFMVP